MEYGYARVSTRKQNEQRQLIALQEFGMNKYAINTIEVYEEYFTVQRHVADCLVTA